MFAFFGPGGAFREVQKVGESVNSPVLKGVFWVGAVDCRGPMFVFFGTGGELIPLPNL